MNEIFKIDLGINPPVFVDTIPEFFTESLIDQYPVRKWCSIDKSLMDILVQRVRAPKISFWKIDMRVYASTMVEFKFGPRKKFNFYNLGQKVQVMFDLNEDFCFERGDHQKMVKLPESKIMFFTSTPHYTKLEVLLVDVSKNAGDLNRIEAEKALLEELSNCRAAINSV